MRIREATWTEVVDATQYGVHNPQRDQEIEARYRAGERITDIAPDYGVTRQRIHQILKARKVPLKEIREARRERPVSRVCSICGEIYDRGLGFRHMGKHRRWQPDDQARAAIEAYLAGEKVTSITTRLGMQYERFYKVLHRMGIKPRTNRGRLGTYAEARAVEAKIIEMMTQGYTQREVAEAVDRSQTWVGYVWRRVR